MHTFSPAKMWIAGLDALRKPLLHLHTQAGMELPWSTIDMDFMNLNQAAHGDREFGYIQSRLGVPRKTVAGHVDSPLVAQRIGALGPRRARAPRAAQPQAGPVRRQHARRRGHRGRQGRGAAALRRLGQHLRRQRPRRGRSTRSATTTSTSWSPSTPTPTASRPSCCPDGERHESLRYGARIELGLRSFLTEGGFNAFTTNFEDLGGLRQLPGLAVQRLMADGYGFGGEGDWKTSVLLRAHEGDGRRPARRHLASWRTTPTTWYPGEEKILGAHMLEVCPTITAQQPSLEIHPLGIGGREDPVRLRFTADPGRAVVAGLSDLGDRFRLTVNEIDVVEPDEDLPQPAGGLRRLGAPARRSRPPPSPG